MLCLLIREINFHVIFPGNEIWRFKGEIQPSATRGKRIPDLVASLKVTYGFLFKLFICHFFKKAQTVVAATFKSNLIIKYQRYLLIFMVHYWL